MEARRGELAALGAEPPEGPITVPHGPPAVPLPSREEVMEEVMADLAMPSMRGLTPDVLDWYFDRHAQDAEGDPGEGAAAAADPVPSAAAAVRARPERAAVELDEADFEEDEDEGEGEEADEGEAEGEEEGEYVDEEADAERLAAIASASPALIKRAWREFTEHMAGLLAEGEAELLAEEHEIREEELPMNRLRDELMEAGEEVLAATDEAAAEALKAQIKGGKRINTLPAELDEVEDEGYSVPPPAPALAPIVAPWESWDEWDWRAWLEKRRARERQFAEFRYNQARRTCTTSRSQGPAPAVQVPVNPACRNRASPCQVVGRANAGIAWPLAGIRLVLLAGAGADAHAARHQRGGNHGHPHHGARGLGPEALPQLLARGDHELHHDRWLRRAAGARRPAHPGPLGKPPAHRLMHGPGSLVPKSGWCGQQWRSWSWPAGAWAPERCALRSGAPTTSWRASATRRTAPSSWSPSGAWRRRTWTCWATTRTRAPAPRWTRASPTWTAPGRRRCRRWAPRARPPSATRWTRPPRAAPTPCPPGAPAMQPDLHCPA